MIGSTYLVWKRIKSIFSVIEFLIGSNQRIYLKTLSVYYKAKKLSDFSNPKLFLNFKNTLCDLIY